MTGDKLKLFISYSRRDMTAADALVTALEGEGFEITIDRRDLPYGEEWQKELGDFIRGSDTATCQRSARADPRQPLEGEKNDVFETDGRLAVRLGGGTARIFDIASGSQVGDVTGNTYDARVAFSSDGLRLATVSGGGLKIWRAVTASAPLPSGNPRWTCDARQCVMELAVDGGASWPAFSPDGQRIAAFTRNTTRIWDTNTGDQVVSLELPAHAIAPARFSPDGPRDHQLGPGAPQSHRRRADCPRLPDRHRVRLAAGSRERLTGTARGARPRLPGTDFPGRATIAP